MEYNALVRTLIDVLRQARIPYMFVGGLAVNYWGFPRNTVDVDLVTALQPQHVKKLVPALRRFKFDLQVEDVEVILRAGNRFMTYSPITPHRVDFWIPRTGFEREAFRRRRVARLEGRRSWVIAPEDLIMMKLLAGRGKDIEDVVSVMERQGDRLDEHRLIRWAKLLELEAALERVRRKQI